MRKVLSVAGKLTWQLAKNAACGLVVVAYVVGTAMNRKGGK